MFWVGLSATVVMWSVLVLSAWAWWEQSLGRGMLRDHRGGRWFEEEYQEAVEAQRQLFEKNLH